MDFPGHSIAISEECGSLARYQSRPGILYPLLHGLVMTLAQEILSPGILPGNRFRASTKYALPVFVPLYPLIMFDSGNERYRGIFFDQAF